MLCLIGQSNEKPPLQVLAKWREYVTRSICYDSFTNWDEKIKGEDTLTKEDMKQISDLMDEKFVAFEGRMDEKFIASEDRMRAEIAASEARTGEKIESCEEKITVTACDEKITACEEKITSCKEQITECNEKIDKVENDLRSEIKKNRISLTRSMQELNAKWVETNEKLDRMLARMEGMDKNMSAMRAEMDAVPKRFDAEIYGKTVFPGGRRQKETFCTVIWSGRIKIRRKHEYFRRILLSELFKYECTVALRTDRGFEELFKCLLEVSHILGACSLIRGVHS